MTLMRASVLYEQGNLKEKVAKTPDQINRDIAAVFEYFGPWGTAWMKMNAPWTDDTGAARAGLVAVAASSGSVHELTLAYSVQYGIWLEVANSGRFQILGPAMRIIGDHILRSIQGLMDGVPPRLGAPAVDITPVARKTARKGTVNKSGNRRSRKAYGRKRNP